MIALSAEGSSGSESQVAAMANLTAIRLLETTSSSYN